MTTLVIAGMTLAAVATVGYPLAGRRAQEEIGDDSAAAEDLRERKDSLYGDLHDLELDRRTGKVAEADYEEMRVAYEIEAARVLERLETGATPNGHAHTCGDCGTDAPAGARFCPGCGRRLAPACPACGEATGPEHRFCGRCGHELPAPGGAARQGREGGAP